MKWDRLFVFAKLTTALTLPLVFLFNPFRSLFLMGCIPGLLVLLFFTHEPIIKKLNSTQRRRTLVCREMDALAGRGNQIPPKWIKPDEGHLYDTDLNISGENGLFAFLSRCITRSGEGLLHRWLLEGVSPDTCRLRQEAAEDLKRRIRFREHFFSTGIEKKNGKGNGMFPNEFRSAEISLKNVVPSAFFVLPLLTIVFIALSTWKIVFLLFFSQLLLNLYTARKQQKILRSCKGVWREIKEYRVLLHLIEQESFRSTRLLLLHEVVGGEKEAPSRLIRRLERALQSLEMRGSALHPLINNLLFWDLFWLARMQSWMRKWGVKLGEWVDVCAEFEALGSIANLSFNHPHWTNPVFVDEPLSLDLEALGHPLLSTGSQTLNSCSIPGPHHLFFVSGPNMAGKSTFLRSVGTAIIMAQCGMPVCARKMVLGKMRPITSLSHSDSLAQGKSLFHKELDRLIQIWNLGGEKEVPVFFLVDEMLRGTNPVDRYNGSLWVLKLLARKLASGIVATHDLRLTNIMDEDNVLLSRQNHHFSCQITAENCIFDYRLYPGTAPSVNALPLMRQRGLPIPDTDR